MDIKEQVLNELAQFCREAESNTDLGERADTMDIFADNIVKLFVIPVVVKSFYCGALVAGKDQCETQCLGCAGFDRICNE
jgi:hypothetical protein